MEKSPGADNVDGDSPVKGFLKSRSEEDGAISGRMEIPRIRKSRDEAEFEFLQTGGEFSVVEIDNNKDNNNNNNNNNSEDDRDRESGSVGDPEDEFQTPPESPFSGAAGPQLHPFAKPEEPVSAAAEAESNISNINNNNDNNNNNNKSSKTSTTSIGKFIREKSSRFSTAIVKSLSSLTSENDGPTTLTKAKPEVTEFHIPGIKVIVQSMSETEAEGRITFYSRSNCRDCTAVRTFFRERGLEYVEINIDVYQSREKELVDRTGTTSVPQIFFNGELIGGLVALNALRNSESFESKLKEALENKRVSTAGGVPERPVYGVDEPEEEERTDVMVEVVRVLRTRLPIQDRLLKMKMVKSCFAGSDVVRALVRYLHHDGKGAIEIGKKLARKHFIHQVFGGSDFEDGNHFYRLLEHEPFIPNCFNFEGSTNDFEPKPAAVIAHRITKIMTAILESYASDDRAHVDYASISKSEEFRRYVILAEELHRVDILQLSTDEKLAFFLNLHNAMVIHAIITGGSPEGIIDRISFFSDFQYLVGGHPYSLTAIQNGILRNNQRPPYTLVKTFGTGDGRLELVLPKVNPLIHFGLCNGTRSSPTVRFFSPQGIEVELRAAAREFFQRGGVEVDLDKRTVHLTRIIKWFDADFGPQKSILNWIINYLDSTKASLLMHLLDDGGPVNIIYQNYDWSVNS